MDTTPASLNHAGEQTWLFALVAALLAFGVYRRMRGHFGAQALRPTAMRLRIGLLAIVGVALLPVGLRSLGFAAAALLGIIAGGLLAVFAAARTRFETRLNGLFYVPHTYTGLFVLVLFLGRVVYRLAELYMSGDLAGAQQTSTMAQTPLTLGLFYVLVSYYVSYLSRILWKSRRLQPGDLETAP